MLLKDEGLYKMLVSSVEKVQSLGLYRSSGDVITLATNAQERCGALPKSRSVGLANLQRQRSFSRRAISIEWALTKVKKHTPSVPGDMPAHASMIIQRLQAKGRKFSSLPVHFQGVLRAMQQHQQQQQQQANDSAQPAATA